MGFEPNSHARRLQGKGVNNSIGLFTLDLDLSVGTRKIRQIRRLLERQGFDMAIHVCSHASEGNVQEVTRELRLLCQQRPRAIRAQTTKQPEKAYQIQLAAKNVAPIAKNDVLLATFWMRTLESPMQEGFVGFTFEQAVEPYKRSFGYETWAGASWTRFDLPFRAAESYAPGEAVMNLRIGFAPQAVEIGGISLRDYGADFDIKSLPATKLTYKGAEPNAVWRKEAAARIEKIRKGDLNIVVRDANGKPVEGAEVIVKQTRQKFAFGSAVNAKALVSDDPADAKYQENAGEKKTIEFKLS